MAHRPHVNVAGIEEVVDIPVEICESALVKDPGIGPSEDVHQRDLALAIPGISRWRRWWEEVSRVSTHLVQINNDMRPEIEEDVYLALGLWLTLNEEVPI